MKKPKTENQFASETNRIIWMVLAMIFLVALGMLSGVIAGLGAIWGLRNYFGF